MDIEEIYINLLTQPFGSRYFKTDLHIHLEPNSYENGKLTSYCKELFEILSENEIEIIALTVHREESLKYLFIAIDILMGLAKDNNYSLEIFPSIELKDVRNTHFAVIFDNNKTKDDIIRFLGGIEKNINSKPIDNLDKCDQITQDITSLSSNIRKKIIDYDAICFFPHPFAEKTGIVKTLAGESLEEFIKNPLTHLWNLGIPITRDIDEKDQNSHCPNKFTPTEIRFDTNKIFKKIARIKVSDSHSLDNLSKIYDICPKCKLFNYCNKGYTYLKLSSPSIKGLKQIQYDHKTRILHDLENISYHPYIVGIYIKSEFFEDKYIRFNPELNSLIGGRGTGKSLIIDFIRFVNGSIPDKKGVYYEIFHDKIRDQLGNGGKVIIFYQNAENKVLAIEKSLILLEESNQIDWKSDTETSFYIKDKDLPFHKSNFIKDTRNLIEALSQTEIPDLHKKTESLLSIIDAFKIDFKEISDRQSEIERLDLLKTELKELYKKYEELKSKQTQIETNLQKEKERYEYLEKIKEVDTKNYQTLLETNKRILSIPELINKWFKKLEVVGDNIPSLDIFDKSSKDLLSRINNLSNQFGKLKATFISSINDLKNQIATNKEIFEKEFKKFLEKWNKHFKTEYEKYKKILKEKDIDFIEKIQEDAIKLKLEIETLERELLNFKKIEEEIIKKEKCMIETAENVNKSTLLIYSERKKIIKEIRNKLRELKILIKIRFKNVKRKKVFKDFLLKVYGTRAKGVVKQIQNDYSPFLLAKAIIDNKISEYSKNFKKNQRMIFEKLNQLVENFEFPLIFTEDLLLIDLLKIYIDRKPIISFKKKIQHKYTPLNRLSIGERCAVLLYIMLLEKQKPFLIDQADAELDQDSIMRFSKYLLNMKKNRQIIVATHNANIPVLGDVDLLLHLNTKPSVLVNREKGFISNRAGFEDSINELLLLEGGKDAIIQRFKKYDWKIPELSI